MQPQSIIACTIRADFSATISARSLDINVSEALINVARSDAGLHFTAASMVKLKGVEFPVPVYQLIRDCQERAYGG